MLLLHGSVEEGRNEIENYFVSMGMNALLFLLASLVPLRWYLFKSFTSGTSMPLLTNRARVHNVIPCASFM